MAKELAVRVNLRTQAKDIVATMRDEMPKAYYYYRKKFGGKQKYLKHEDQMIDKALEEKNDQFTDIDYWISKVGNRWMTYTQTQYFPKALYAIAFHFSFIYYETFASCGAFFPLYDPKKSKSGKVTDKTKITGVILYTDHFFYQMSERTKIEYRSKELIKEFISQRLEHAMTIDDESGDVIVKFKGGHGFGKQYSKNPQYIAIRTFLRDEELNAKQRRDCEPVDMMYELVKDGMFMKQVSLNTALLQDPYSKESIEQSMKKYEALKKFGMEKRMALLSGIQMIFWNILEEYLNMKLDDQQLILISHTLGHNSTDFLKKWEDVDYANNHEEELKQEMVEIFYKSAKELKLKHITRDIISEKLEKMHEEGLKAKSDNKQDN